MKINQLLETPIDMTGDPNDPVVYGHEKANPMSLKGRIVQARNQLKELAQLAESDDLVAWEKITRLAKGGMFMGLEQNLEQIRHGINELAAKRKQGGVASRGIDKNIGEAISKKDLVGRLQKDLPKITDPKNKDAKPAKWTGPGKDDYGYTGYQGHGMPTDKQERESAKKNKDVAEDKQKGVDGKACWDGYKRMGTKKKGGKTVDNCVPTGKK
jgi:hypothetical protein